VVTNILFESAEGIYDGVYTGRGDAENRIKELKVHLKADRLSCTRFKANQFRLLLRTFAFVLLWRLRRSLAGTELAAATVNTLKLKLFKGRCPSGPERPAHPLYHAPGLSLSTPVCHRTSEYSADATPVLTQAAPEPNEIIQDRHYRCARVQVFGRIDRCHYSTGMIRGRF